MDYDKELEVISSKGNSSDVKDTVEILPVQYDKIYVTRVSFGGSKHNLLIDTGSSWTWVNSCDSEAH